MNFPTTDSFWICLLVPLWPFCNDFFKWGIIYIFFFCVYISNILVYHYDVFFLSLCQLFLVYYDLFWLFGTSLCFLDVSRWCRAWGGALCLNSLDFGHVVNLWSSLVHIVDYLLRHYVYYDQSMVSCPGTMGGASSGPPCVSLSYWMVPVHRFPHTTTWDMSMWWYYTISHYGSTFLCLSRDIRECPSIWWYFLNLWCLVDLSSIGYVTPFSLAHYFLLHSRWLVHMSVWYVYDLSSLTLSLREVIL